MIFKNIKAVTSSLRHVKLLKKSENFTLNLPLKNKIFFIKNSGGRNNQGKITSYQKGGGVKKLYRKIDFLRQNQEGIVEKIEYDPYRTGFIGRIYNYKLKQHFYILAPHNLMRGDYIKSGKDAPIQIGNSLSLSDMPVGSIIHNISIKPGLKGQLARSAGTFGQLIQKNDRVARIKLPSGEQRLILIDNHATLGSVSNINHRYVELGKAGRARWLNKRPIVRGVAMNPVDHPHGGGEGKTSGGRPSVTPWGKPTKGQPTAKFKNNRPYILISYKNKKLIKNVVNS